MLVVDDDPDVFHVTQLVLRRTSVLGKPLKLTRCDSGASARQKLSAHTDVAVLISDVVMEEEDAGLQLVQWVPD